MTITIVYPDGTTETFEAIPAWDRSLESLWAWPFSQEDES